MKQVDKNTIKNTYAIFKESDKNTNKNTYAIFKESDNGYITLRFNVSKTFP